MCFGLQLAVVEFARNVCNLNAHTTEIDPETEHPVITLLPSQQKILEQNNYGATMRLGSYAAKMKEGTLAYELYKLANRIREGKVFERHRHRYEVNPAYHKILQEKGLVFSGIHLLEEGVELVEFIELPRQLHPFFVATQAHPEFTSTLENPNPLFYGFLKACKERKHSLEVPEI